MLTKVAAERAERSEASEAADLCDVQFQRYHAEHDTPAHHKHNIKGRPCARPYVEKLRTPGDVVLTTYFNSLHSVHRVRL